MQCEAIHAANLLGARRPYHEPWTSDPGLLTLTFQTWAVGAGGQEVEGTFIICLMARDLQGAFGKRLWTSGRGLGGSLDTFWGAWGRLLCGRVLGTA